MKYLRQVYYHASAGSPDAIPAGIIAVDLGFNEANFNDEEMIEIRNCITSYGLFDDTAWQLEFQMDDVDLVRGEVGSMTYITSDIIVADWQWKLIKEQPGLRVAEHNLSETIEEIERWCEEEGL
jgi:hypothetical protein